jgi:hypothetical protein
MTQTFDGPQIEGMLDLDALMDDIPEDSKEDMRAFAQEVKAQAATDNPMHHVIGVWVAKGMINWPDTAMLLYRFGCYREVPVEQQEIHSGLACEIVCFQLLKSPHSVAMYRAMQATNILQKFFTRDEQSAILFWS